MADGKKLIERKFLLEKKSIKLEDCKLYVEEYHPEDKKWFYDLCCKEYPVMKDNQPTGETALLSFLSIKSKFYEKYFPQEGTLSARMKLFADWDIPADEEAEEQK